MSREAVSGFARQEPLLRVVNSGGVEIAAWDWPGNAEKRPLLFAHAIGFHGRAWDEVARRFPERRRVAIDFRGHGRSAKPDPPYPWRDFGRDLAAVADALRIEDALGVGHSMGGHATVCAASAQPAIFARLLLIDPSIFPPETYGAPASDASFIRKRKNVFHSAGEMIERYRNRLPFARWDPQALRDYCVHGLVPRGSAFVLACPPEIEESLYYQARVPDANIYPEVASIRQPVTVARAGRERRPGVFDLSTSPTAANLASYFANAKDIVFEECTHYIPQEAPGRVADEIARELEQ